MPFVLFFIFNDFLCSNETIVAFLTTLTFNESNKINLRQNFFYLLRFKTKFVNYNIYQPSKKLHKVFKNYSEKRFLFNAAIILQMK